jgi:hypothetical protein
MNTSRFHGTRVSLWSAITVLVTAMWLLVPSANAQGYTVKTVNCDNPALAQYGNIQQALNSFDWVGMLEIEVTGTCHGRITIGDSIFAFNSVWIHPPDGQRAAISPNTATGVVIQIGGAHGIWIERLDISGGNRGVEIYDASEVDFSDVTIENNTGDGVRATGNSIVYFGSSRIRNNGVHGVDVSLQGESTVYFSGGPAPDATVIEGNGQLGVNAGALGTAWFAGNNIVRNNGGNTTATTHGGIHATRNSTVQVLSDTRGATEITGNVGPGILAEVNSSVSLQGANIHANTEQGVRARTRSVVELLGQNTFASNGIASLSCDTWSLVTGDFTGIDLKSIDCKNVDLPPNK